MRRVWHVVGSKNVYYCCGLRLSLLLSSLRLARCREENRTDRTYHSNVSLAMHFHFPHRSSKIKLYKLCLYFYKVSSYYLIGSIFSNLNHLYKLLAWNPRINKLSFTSSLILVVMNSIFEGQNKMVFLSKVHSGLFTQIFAWFYVQYLLFVY